MPSAPADLHEEPGFERRWYTLEHMSWVIMGLLLAAACLGLTGPGVLSERHEQAPGGLRVEYERRLHIRLPAEVRLHVSGANEALELQVTGALAQSLMSSSPAPLVQERSNGTLHLRYAAHHTPAEIVLTYRPERVGSSVSAIAAPGTASALTISQFVLP